MGGDCEEGGVGRIMVGLGGLEDHAQTYIRCKIIRLGEQISNLWEHLSDTILRMFFCLHRFIQFVPLGTQNMH